MVKSSPSSSRDRLLWLLGLAAVLALQFGLFAYFGGEMLLSDHPHAGLDFDTHITQAYRVVEGLEGWNRSWVYDVQLLAGAPNGVLFDADNKGWALATFAGKQLGLSAGFAFNLFVIAAHLSVVPVVYGAARAFRMSPWGALLAATFAVLYWNFDSWSHWCWYVGMVAYGFASVFFLIPLALFYRWSDERRNWQLVGTAVSLALAHLIHPYSFFILATPMLVLYVRAAPTLGKRGHAGVLAVVATVLLVNAYWLLNAYRFWHYILDSSLFADTSPVTAVWDVLGVMTEPAATGIIGKRAAFRTVFLLGGLVMSVVWWRRFDGRAKPLGGALVVLIAMGYFGGWTVLSQTQPYRNLLPAGILGAICTAALIEHAIVQGVFAGFSAGARVTVGVLALPAVLFLSKDVLYFTYTELPAAAMLPHGERVQLSPLGYPAHPTYGYASWHADALAEWLEEHDDHRGRVLVEGWSTGEQLAWKTKSQILGGFIWRNLEHSWANIFRRKPQGIAHPKEWQRYFRTYAVRWVIVSTPPSVAPWWDRNSTLEHVTNVGHFRIYKVREPSGFIAKGPGRVVASTNRIEVYGTDPSRPVTLRYHWLETLRCKPDCSIERREVGGDKVGFIRIPAGHPADFLVFNKYAFPK